MKPSILGGNLNRRNFIRKTSLGIGALGIGLPLVKGSKMDTMDKDKDKLGVALVGLGYYASQELAPSLLDTEHCYLAGIVTGSKEKEAEWMKKYNIPRENVYDYQNFDSIKDNADIDIVYVVLPNSMHAEYTIRAAKAGKHVICEKPMALSVHECEQMISACKKNKVMLSVGYRLHFDPYTQKIMSFANEKPFGEINYVNADFGFTIGDPTQWRLNKELAGGGALMDVGIYCIQAARYTYALEPLGVSAQVFTYDKVKFKEVEETITWQMQFPGGGVSNSTSSYSLNVNRQLISMEKALAELDPAFGYRGIKCNINNKALELPQVNQQAKQMDAFALNVKSGTQSTVSGEEGLKDLKVIEAIYKSVQNNGKTILI